MDLVAAITSRAPSIAAILVERERAQRAYRDQYRVKEQAGLTLSQARQWINTASAHEPASPGLWADYGRAEHAYQAARDELDGLDMERRAISDRLMAHMTGLSVGLDALDDEQLAAVASGLAVPPASIRVPNVGRGGWAVERTGRESRRRRG